jgi:hypothetical protein
MHKLLLHAGAATASFDEVAAVPTPDGNARWTPIPHALLLQTVIDQVTASGMTVAEPEYALWGKAGERFFGVLTLRNGDNHDDYATLIGLRNSHDQSYSAGLVCGARVFICDNRSFSGEVRMDRKHTSGIFRDLPGLTNRALGRLHDLRGFQDQRIAAYKAWEINDQMVHDFIIRTVDLGVLKPTKIPALLAEWRTPTHDEFKPRTAWSLFNAYTEVLKGAFTELPRRTMTLHGMVDLMVGVEKPAAIEVIDDEAAVTITANDAAIADAEDFIIEEA